MPPAVGKRDELFDLLKYGKIEPAEAEAEALRLSLDPLRSVPDLADFDPIQQAHWTLPMAVAWIAYRSTDAVREWWPAYREQCWDWWFRKWRIGFDGDVHEGWLLEQRPPATLSLLLIGDAVERDVARDPNFSMTAREAQKALWDALGSDCFRSTGIDQETCQRVQMLPITWTELKCYEENGHDELRANALQTRGAGRYRDVLLPRASLMGLWRAPYVRPKLSLPETMVPAGDGYMPLYCAAQWIATEGGRVDFDPEDADIWRTAFEQLLDAISSDAVLATGLKDGLREPIAGHYFAGLRVAYPFDDPLFELILSEEFYLQSYPYDDEDDWRGGFSDSIRNRHGERWSRVMLRKEHVLARWPFAPVRASDRSGFPGRPSSKHLVFEELRRRAADGRMLDRIGKESQALSRWLAQTFPDKPQATATSIETSIRDLYRDLKASKQ